MRFSNSLISPSTQGGVGDVVLAFDGRVLPDDGSTLASHHVGNDSVLQLIVPPARNPRAGLLGRDGLLARGR
jgi:hypothetical protein